MFHEKITATISVISFAFEVKKVRNRGSRLSGDLAFDRPGRAGSRRHALVLPLNKYK